MANIETEWALEKLESLRQGLGSSKRSVTAGETLEQSIEGFRLYEQHRYEEARAVFRELSAREPKQAFHRAALGLVCLAMDSLSEAERELTKSIRLSNKEPSAFITRGEVYLRLGRYADAAGDFERAVKLVPQRHDPLAKRARLLASTAREMLGGPSKQTRAPARRLTRKSPRAVARAPVRRVSKRRRK